MTDGDLGAWCFGAVLCLAVGLGMILRKKGPPQW